MLPIKQLILFVFLLIAAGLTCAAQVGEHPDTNPVERRFLAAGLIDVQRLDPSIRVDLVNSNADHNFFGEDFYHGLQQAYLQRSVAKKVVRAQKHLQRRRPGHALQIMDAARPRSVSRAMYEMMKDTRFRKYVAHPAKGSMHNYGAAVDITIADAEGELLDMGFNPFYKSKLFAAVSFGWSKLRGSTDQQKANRALLKRIMVNAGFIPLAHEWWHFSGCSRKQARKRFKIIE